MRDVSRSSRNVVRVAMGRGRRQVTCALGETSAADGEVVWSWRRDPGATLAVSPAGNGGKKGRFPGESTYNPKNHCAGKVGMSWLVPVKSVCVFYYPLHTVLRVPPAPGLLRALYSGGSKRNCRTRAKTRRGNAFGFLKTESTTPAHLAPLAGGRGSRPGSTPATRCRHPHFPTAIPLW